jgi:hypothetical protein
MREKRCEGRLGSLLFKALMIEGIRRNSGTAELLSTRGKRRGESNTVPS